MSLFARNTQASSTIQDLENDLIQLGKPDYGEYRKEVKSPLTDSQVNEIKANKRVKILGPPETNRVYLKQKDSIKNSLQESKNTLESLKCSEEALDKAFYLRLDLFAVLYTFDGLKELRRGEKEDVIRGQTCCRLMQVLSSVSLKANRDPNSQVSTEDSEFIAEEKERELLKMRFSKDPTINKLLILEHYLKLIIEIKGHLTEVPIIEESNILELCYDSSTLFSHFSQQLLTNQEKVPKEFEKHENLAEKLQCVLSSLTKLFLEYFASKLSQKNSYLGGSKLIFEWAELTIQLHSQLQKFLSLKILNWKEDLLGDLLDLLIIGFCLKPESVHEALSNNRSLIPSILTLYSNEAWEVPTTTACFLLFDALLNDSLPVDLAIETRINKLLMNSSNDPRSVKLLDLQNDMFISQEQRVNMDCLVSILLNKFEVSSNIQNYYSEENLLVSFNPSQPKQPAKTLIQEILTRLSPSAEKTLSILTHSIIENYLSNLCQLSESITIKTPENMQIRETSSLLVMISILFSKYSYLTTYISLKKEDYTALISKYAHKTPFLKDLDHQNFKSITFLDCLIQMKYFFFHKEDLSLLIEMITRPTGLICEDPYDPQNILDISYLLTENVISSMSQQLGRLESEQIEKDYSPLGLLEKYLAFKTAVYSFIEIQNRLNLEHISMQSKACIKRQILGLLNQILLQFEHIAKYNFGNIEKYKHVNNLLVNQLNKYFTSELSGLKLNKEDLNKYKEENYKEVFANIDYINQALFVDSYHSILEDTNRDTEIIWNIPKYIDLMNDKRSFPMKTGTSRMVSNTRVPYFNTWSMLGNIEHISCPDLDLGQPFSTVPFERMNDISSYFEDIKKYSPQEGPFTNYLQAFERYMIQSRPDIGLRNQILNCLINKSTQLFKINEASSQETPTSNNKDFIKIIQESKGWDLNESMIEIDIKDSDIKDDLFFYSFAKGFEESKTQDQIFQLKYFLCPTVQTQAEFDSIKRHLMIELKILSEKVHLARAHSSLSKEEFLPFKKALIAEEIDSISLSLSFFEKSFLLYLLDHFDPLKPFDYPDGFQEIKQELRWIEKNLPEYLNRLKSLGIIDLNLSMKIPIEEKSSYLDPLVVFSSNFRLCKDYPSGSTEPKPSDPITKLDLDKNGPWFKEIYIIPDDVVQALASLFYTKSEKGLFSSNLDIFKIFEGLSNSPSFEVKLLDFCLFFLYSPDHLSMRPKASNQFPYGTIHNVKERLQVYNVVALNILDFLTKWLKSREYLYYQPRWFLENYGLESLRKPKLNTVYFERTVQMVSICDLIVGLLDVKDLISDSKLYKEVVALVTGIFSKERPFQVRNVKEGEEYIQVTKIFSVKSCQRLLQMKNIELVLKNISNIIVYDFAKVVVIIRNAVNIMVEPVMKTNKRFKNNVDKSVNITTLEIQPILDLQQVLANLTDILSLSSSALLNFDSKKDASNEKAQIEEERAVYKKALKILEQHIFQDQTLKKLIIQLFELLVYLSDNKVNKPYEANNLASNIAEICFYFYALFCIQQPPVETNVIKEEDLTKDKYFKLSQTPKKKPLNKEKSVCEPRPPSLYFKLSQAPKKKPLNKEEIVSEPRLPSLPTKKSEQDPLDIYFAKLCKKHLEVLNSIIVNNKRQIKEITMISKRLSWILKFDLKKKIFMNLLSKDAQAKGVQSSTREIKIDRENLIKSVLKKFSNKTMRKLQKKIRIIFNNENGYDAGGLKREFFTVILKELFDIKSGLFQVCKNNTTLHLNPLSCLIPAHLKYLELAGMLLAKAIQEGCVVDINLTTSFLKHILKKEITLDDLEEIDNDLIRSLQWVSKHSVEGLEQTFTYETEVFGEKVMRELMPNGYDLIITDDNKKEFISRLCEMKTKGEVEEELASFLKGFYLIIPPEFLDIFTPSDLQLLIAGNPSIDIKEMKTHASYNNCSDKDELIKWLWEILEGFSQKQLAAFLFFVTGSSKLPYGGLKEKPIKYRKVEYRSGQLPVAHTCSCEIEIPLYRSKEEFKEKLVLALFEGQGGFYIS